MINSPEEYIKKLEVANIKLEQDLNTVKKLAKAVVDTHEYPAYNYLRGCKFCGQCTDDATVTHRPFCIVLDAQKILKDNYANPIS